MVAAGVISERDRIGNQWADKYADLGAAFSSPASEDIQVTQDKHTQAKYVQLRLAECDLVQFEHRTSNPRAIPPEADKPPPVPPPHGRPAPGPTTEPRAQVSHLHQS